MAVNSKADKTGGHKSSGLKRPAYTAAPVAAPATLGTAGTKALLSRAKRELQPVEDPNQAPTT